jgi:hypothetical protein
MDPRSILCDLIEITRPLDEILINLKRLAWDSEVPLVTLEQRHLASVLRRYRDGNLSGEAVEIWANAIEGRDDIGYEPDTIAGRLLFELANPRLTARLTPARASELLDLISEGLV